MSHITFTFCSSESFILKVYWKFAVTLLSLSQIFCFSSLFYILCFLSALLSSSHPLTFPLHTSLSIQVVSQRFPQNSIGAVGSAMFLRFINPAIVSPYEAGILDKKPLPRVERGLKLMSKVSQESKMSLWRGWHERNEIIQWESYHCIRKNIMLCSHGVILLNFYMITHTTK